MVISMTCTTERVPLCYFSFNTSPLVIFILAKIRGWAYFTPNGVWDSVQMVEPLTNLAVTCIVMTLRLSISHVSTNSLVRLPFHA